MRGLFMLLCAFLLACGEPAFKQPPLHANGFYVRSEYEESGSTAKVEIVDGECVFKPHPEVWPSLSPAVQWFVFHHEVGHCQLVAQGGGTEAQADCYAAVTMVSQGFTFGALEEAADWLEGRSEHKGYAGEERSQIFMGCAAMAYAVEWYRIVNQLGKGEGDGF